LDVLALVSKLFKGKSSKSSGSEKLIIDYLVKQNRPYSAQDLLNNLEGKVGKTELVNKLDELASANKIIEKIYGKQKVYMAIQVAFFLQTKI
jgi:26S proteasome regulatory subunit (ATPase 3-interacting protein)